MNGARRPGWLRRTTALAEAAGRAVTARAFNPCARAPTHIIPPARKCETVGEGRAEGGGLLGGAARTAGGAPALHVQPTHGTQQLSTRNRAGRWVAIGRRLTPSTAGSTCTCGPPPARGAGSAAAAAPTPCHWRLLAVSWPHHPALPPLRPGASGSPPSCPVHGPSGARSHLRRRAHAAETGQVTGLAPQRHGPCGSH
jgi:hypothetical protein